MSLNSDILNGEWIDVENANPDCGEMHGLTYVDLWRSDTGEVVPNLYKDDAGYLASKHPSPFTHWRCVRGPDGQPG